MKKILLTMICFVLVGCSYSYEAEIVRIEEENEKLADRHWQGCRQGQRVNYVQVTKGGDAFLMYETYKGQIKIHCGYYGKVGDVVTFQRAI